MKQVIRKGLKDIIVDDVPAPVVTRHHVLVEPSFSLISSGTETASIHTEGVLREVSHNPSHIRKVWDAARNNGPLRTLSEVKAKFSDYAVLGYSGAGVIVELHPTVTDLEIGQRVAYGGEGTGHGECISTGRRLVASVPDDVSLEHATFATLGSIAMNAVRIAQIGLGENVAVIGLGLVGQLVAQLARLQGATVIAIDLRPERVARARELGADHAVIGGDSLRERVSALTSGKGVDCAIVAAAAKSSAPCEQALTLCRDRGRIVVVGAVEMSFPWLEMYLKEIQLFMSRAYGPGSYDPAYEQRGEDYPLAYVRWTENRNMEEFLRLLQRGRVRVDELISHRYPLENAPEAYRTIMEPGSSSLAVVLRYPVADARPDAPRAALTRRVELPSARPGRAGAIRLALVGAGNIARWAHLPVITKMDDLTLRAVYSASGARGKSYARRFGAGYCCSDYQEILGDPDIDAVLIVTRNAQHAAQAAAALDAGKHVFVEKPMALTEEECRTLLEAVRRSGKQLMVGFNRRFAPFYVEQKRQLSRRTGPAVINCRVNSPGISGSYWMADPAIGGAILGEACHFTDLFCWLLDQEPRDVSAFSLPTGVAEPIGENNITAVFRFADGSIASLAYCTVGSRTSGGERVEVFAPAVAAQTENFKRLDIQAAQVQSKTKMFADKGYAEQMRAFVSAIRSGTPPEAGVREGARSTIMCLRMLEAARTLERCDVAWEDAVG